MKWALFVVGLTLGAIGAFAAMKYAGANRPKLNADDYIIFAEKAFAEKNDIWVGIAGALTGPDLAYPNNAYSIVCFKDRIECWIASIEQIAKDRVGRLQFAYSMPIKQWDESEVIAGNDADDWRCTKSTITISRKTGTASWVDEPIHQTRPACNNAGAQVRKYTIEDSPGWKSSSGK